MSKRKRNFNENEQAPAKKVKQAKIEEQCQVKSDSAGTKTPHAKANLHSDRNGALESKPDQDIISARKLEKRERRKSRRALQAAAHAQIEIQVKNQDQAADTAPLQAPKSKKRKHKHDQLENGQYGTDAGWKFSNPVGGRMLDLDPIYSPDEQHLLLAFGSEIAVYSIATSLPICRLRPKDPDQISAFALSFWKEDEMYLSTISGTIERWDWKQGSRIGHWRLSSSIYGLTTSTQTKGDAKSDLVYTIDRKGKDPWLISAHRLSRGKESSSTGVKTLFSNNEAFTSLKTLEGGRFIVATSGAQLIIGNSSLPDPAKMQELSYTWRIVNCPEWIISVDVRISNPERQSKKSKGGTKLIESLDIALGGQKGSIHVYENLLGNLVRREQPTSKDSSGSIKSRRLHWHRNAVLAVKWSKDGNYLISGGEETVLVIWQLETGQRQDLPHLGAPVESIVISPFGSSYGLRLADNSAMILSTTELRPTFSVAGIQVPRTDKESNMDMPYLATVDRPALPMKTTKIAYTPACTSPSHPGSIFLAVPPAVPSKSAISTSQNASYLQTIDLGAGHQLARQALTRTKITTLNMGPESNTIEEPNVTHVQTSASGHWLATIDAWTPPRRDLAYSSFDEDHMSEEQNFRQEIYLKFWSWNNEIKAWELASRVDNPHASRNGNPYEHCGVLELASNPSSDDFATVGVDGTIKIWKPAVRRRHGLDVRNHGGQSLTSWYCRHIIPLESSYLIAESGHQAAKLAYSRDGSILAGALKSSAATPINIIDTNSGEIKCIQSGFCDGPLLGLGIVDKYLVTLSHQLCVVDLVEDKIHYGINLHSYGLSSDKLATTSHLAVELQQGLFAIALPELTHSTNHPTELRAQLAIFTPSDATPLFKTSVPNTITTLLPNSGRRGFIAIDSAAEVRTLSSSNLSQSLASTVLKDEKEPPRGLGDIFGGDRDAKASDGEVGKHAALLESRFGSVVHEPQNRRDDMVVSQDRLAEIFDVGPSHALPPIEEMFERVASLYNGRRAA